MNTQFMSYCLLRSYLIDDVEKRLNTFVIEYKLGVGMYFTDSAVLQIKITPFQR